MIDNPDMTDPLTALLFLGEAMGPGGTAAAIEAQEKRGQTQLVHSDRLPVDTHGRDAEFTALGFVFGEPDPADPIFRPATLPDGWTRQAAAHSMWSYLLDEHGRRRASVFFKAAHYDRSSHMSLVSLAAYLDHCLYDSAEVVCDDTWATPAAVAATAREIAEQTAQQVAFWTEHQRPDYVQEYTEKRAQWQALADRYAAGATAAAPAGGEGQ